MEALIVVDMQKDFCYENGKLFVGEHVKSIFDPLKKVIKKSREKMPIIFTQDWHREDDVEFKIWNPHCIMYTEGAEIIDELEADKQDYYIKKRRYSAFFETDLDLTLRELNVKKLYFAGVVTNICVLHSVGDAVLRGYKACVLKDCTTAITDYEYEYAINHMKSVFNAEILSSEDFLSFF
ncbi:cysteine hydrolase [Archaeoglobales archaeon]|nr:MAG: cysteine hydrolase [Archaeoglobales archaeon]